MSRTSARFSLALLLVLLGAASRGITVDDSDDPGSNTILVTVNFPHAPQDRIERQITIPLEEQLARVPGLTEIDSVTEHGRSRVQLRFSAHSDLNDAYLDVRHRVDRARTRFPAAAHRPVLSRSDLDARPLFVVALPMDAWSEQQIRGLFEQAEGVGRVDISGAPQRNVEVVYNPDELPRLLDGAATIARAMHDTVLIASTAGEGRVPLMLDTRGANPMRFAAVPLTGGLSVGGVAEVRSGTVSRSSIGRVNASPRSVASVFKAGDANSIEVSRRLRDISAAAAGVQILLDRGGDAERRLNEVLLAVGLGIIGIFALSVAVDRSWRCALIAASTVIVSALAAVAALAASGMRLTVLTLAGIALASGLAIDNAVVFLAALRQASGDASLAAAGARAPIVYSSLTTAVVFIPLVFAPLPIVREYGGLATVVVSSLTAAALYVLLLVPALLHRPIAAPHELRPLRRTALLRTVETAVRFSCRHHHLVVLAGLAVALLAGSLAGAVMRNPPAAFDRRSLGFTLQLDPGTTAETVFVRTQSVELRAMAAEGVSQVISDYSTGRARFLLRLREGADRQSIRRAVESEAERISAATSGSFGYFDDDIDQRGGRSIEIMIRGPEAHETQQLARTLAGAITTAADVDHIVFHFRDGAAANVVRIDLNSVSRFGVNPRAVLEEIRWAIGRQVATKWHGEGVEHDVLLRAESAQLGSIGQLMDLPIFGEGRDIALAAFATLHARSQPSAISRTGRSRSARLTVVTRSRRRTLQQLHRLLKESPPPLHYTVDVAPREQHDRSQRRIQIAGAVLALCLIVVVLVVHYERSLEPLVILLQLPLVFGAPILVLGLLSARIELPIFVGLILCAGISVNNSILVFDGLGAVRREGNPDGESLVSALIAAGRPLAMASITTLVGIAPLLFNGLHDGLLSILSLTLTVGVLTSLGATIVLLPALCLTLRGPDAVLQRSDRRPQREPFSGSHEPRSAAPAALR